MKFSFYSFLLLATLTSPAPAATRLCDLETDAEFARIRWASRGQSQLERAGSFATVGEASLQLTSPAWRAGQPEWPAFEFEPVERDWTGYDRLVVDITNPGAKRHLFALFVSDDKVPFRQGLSYRFELPERGFRRFVVPLSTFPAAVNRADIGILHFFTERPETDLALHLDHLTLLRPGESLPEPGPAFVQQLVPLKLEHLAATAKTVAAARTPVAGTGVEPLLAQLAAHFNSIQQELQSPTLTLPQLDALARELAGTPGRVTRLESMARFQQACAASGQPATNLLVGVAPSTEKILPRDTPVDVAPARTIELSLARNEKESVQLLVLSPATDLKGVLITVTDLKSAAGDVFDRNQVDCDVMGYVETKAPPPYGTSHIGWWPDPILDFLGPVDITAGDLQSFWIRVRAPKEQPPGTYHGTLTVSAAGVASQAFPLSIRVRSFAVPTHSPLPLAITFAPHDTATVRGPASVRKASPCRPSDWRTSATASKITPTPSSSRPSCAQGRPTRARLPGRSRPGWTRPKPRSRSRKAS